MSHEYKAVGAPSADRHSYVLVQYHREYLPVPRLRRVKSMNVLTYVSRLGTVPTEYDTSY